MTNQPQYRIVEIFESLQGEGFNTGMPAIFIRFGKCNLACSWCDTEYLHYQWTSLTQILEQLAQYKASNIIITGGEPTVQPQLEILLQQLKQQGYYLCIETNGLRPVSALFDYIAVSPKYCYASKYEQYCISQASEMRIVVEQENIIEFAQQMSKKIQAQHYFLSAIEQKGSLQILPAIQQLAKLNASKQQPYWQLSLQTHKLIGIA